MANPTDVLHPLPPGTESTPLPDRFTFPFYYRPHTLAVAAAEDLQAHLRSDKSWDADFGLDADGTGRQGKMFGVLVVAHGDEELSYLAAYSGKLADSNHLPGFVPPVYDLLDERGFYRSGESEINAVTLELEALQANPAYIRAKQLLETTRLEAEQELQRERQLVKAGKQRRREAREAAADLSPTELEALEKRLAAESIRQSYGLKDLKRALEHRVQLAEEDVSRYEIAISRTEKRRREMSAALQDRIFTEYAFLNAEGQTRGLGSIFSETVFGVPPAGAGECAAPKLLQYAFIHGLRPIALAEFWWGQSPGSEIRQHGHYYPACKGKCEPILSHMLQGLEVDENPLLVNPARGKTLRIVYEDDDLLVIDKPHEFLSVPGKHIQDSVYQRIRGQYPEATGPLVVHRLDMSTSGLLLVTKRKEVHKQLQRQFFRRSVEKRYQALVVGAVAGTEGFIDLPLRGDLDDRPRQIVCSDHGKAARTRWKVVEATGGNTRVDLWPVTGRTHQLRVHCAHPEGLGAAIVGDDLYGQPDDRLCLHAAWIAFVHPTSRERMAFESSVPF
ncbi:tRNA pseudouridine32 synthase / 23S rRNA pseudouridine746 synthase [Neolewinella xylanilytica]|uniref:tRNA pseudouridine32 synthase / 23S rRNA pseudouridine746 synthase n=1 Tax=Neolewinella xylanilytica TaxID=1514080 RepID=A0A2S6I5V8_9BACT|nr:pseudouridine synthase [Neolewinella xylanilytica]PPK86535.1 tRNA pseudouridine32 synthase / 23S rRNA pseudouridine746 synthase [Neolewinella xylanilytica]